MSLPGLAARRLVATGMATLGVVVLGLVSLAALRIDLLPDVGRPTVTVRTNYPGASSEVVERSVTRILEEVVSTVPGVVELTSTSAEGESRITVDFAWGTDLDAAVQDLRARLEEELDELPEEIERPTVRSFDINSFPVVLLGVSGPLDPVELTRLVEDELRDRLARVPGVAQVDPWGGYNRELRVSLDPVRLRALGVSLEEVVGALRDGNLDLPAGRVEQGRHELSVRAPAELTTADEIADLVVAVRGGAVITLGQVGVVEDTWEALTRLVRVGEEPGVRLAIRKQAEANTVEVASAVLAEAARIRRELPQLAVVPVLDQGNFIEQSIANVGRSVAYGGLFAVLVLLAFLREARSTLVVAASIPVSVLGTLVWLYVGGFTLNLMTLGGLALGVGMMVDSSIVVLESVFQRRERGGSSLTAAVDGAVEVAPALVASTLTTLVIFLPVVFLQGIAGLLFRELAWVIAASLTVSLVVSLTVVPALTSRIPPAAPGERLTSGLVRRLTAAIATVESAYRRALTWAVGRRAATVAVAGGVLAASLLLTPWIGTGFLPPTDEGEVRVSAELELGTRIGLVDRQTRRMEEVVFDAVPEAIASVTTVRGGATGEAIGEIQLALGPRAARGRSNVEVADDLRGRLAGAVAGATVRTRAPQGSFAINRLLGEDQEGVVVEVRGDDLGVLTRLTEELAGRLAAVEGVTDVVDTRPEGVPELRLTVDRARVADLGLSPRRVAELLEVAVAGRQVGELRQGGDAWRIFVQLDDVERRSRDELLDLTLERGDAGPVLLRQVVDAAAAEGPISIARKDQRRLVTVTANVADRDLGSVAADVERALADLPRPAGTTVTLGGAWEAQQETFSELRVSLLLSLALVYMVLAAQYESLRDPLVVMVSVPFAGVGVILTLALTGTQLDLQSGIGVIMLGGIVVNNAILLVDHASHLRAVDGLSAREAALGAGERRLRPILMTTLTTVFGLLPLALGLGEGADAQAPLARAVLGGLVTSTASSLVLIPVVYTWMWERPARGGAG